MSVEKVNKYKEEKANRKEILEKQKKQAKAARAGVIAGAIVVAALIVGAIGITIRNERKAYLAALPDYNATTMIVGDMAGVLAKETEAPADETEAPADETEAPADETQAPADETQAPAAQG